MKFVCTHCGKQFDVGRFGEICPRCGCVNTLSSQSTQQAAPPVPPAPPARSKRNASGNLAAIADITATASRVGMDDYVIASMNEARAAMADAEDMVAMADTADAADRDDIDVEAIKAEIAAIDAEIEVKLDNLSEIVASYGEAVARSKKKGNDIVAVVSAGLAMLVLALFVAICAVNAKAESNKGPVVRMDTQPWPITTTMQQQNEAFACSISGRRVTVGTAQTIDDCQWVQDGAVFVRAWVQLGESTQSSSQTETNFYLQVNGEYYQNAYSMRLVEDEIAEEAELLENHFLRRDDADEGWVYFVVPQDAEKHILWVETVNTSGDLQGAERSEMIGIELTMEGME